MRATTAKTERTAAFTHMLLVGKTLAVIILSRTSLAGANPFGIAYAAVLAEENAIAAVAGLVLGAVGSSEIALKYIIAGIIYGVIIYARKFREAQMKAMALGTAVALASVVALFRVGATPARLLIMIPEAFAAGGLYYLFGNLKSKGVSSYYAELIFAGVLLRGAYGIRLPYVDVSVSVFLAMLIVMSASYSCGVPVSVLTGAALGFMIFAGEAQAIEISGIFAISALCGALLAKTGKTGVSAGFLTGATVCVLCMGRLGGLTAGDIFAAPIIFLIIPQKTAVRVGSHINGKFSETQYDEAANERIKTVAKAVQELGNGVQVLSRKKEEDGGIYAELAGRVCKNCKKAEFCYRNGGEMPKKTVTELKKAMEKDGYLNFSNVPKEFARECVRAERFLGEFLHISELEKQNEILRGELASERELVARQYGEISNIIDSLSEREEKRESEERFAVTVAVCQEAKRGQEINGDAVVHFQKGNKYYVILCDGMGSGSAAREISGLTAHLFAEFFSSGIEKETAVNMINSAIALNADRESFSSADILEFDMSTGEAEFLKIGSAQSFIKVNKEIETVSSESLPIGILETIEVKPQKFGLSAGDEILMITDGIGEATKGVMKNEWIKKLFLSSKESVEERVRLLLDGARARNVFGDDMTGVIIKIKNKRN